VKTLISEAAHSSPASSFQSTATTSLPVPGGSPGTVISEMYNLVDQAKKASPAQGELAEIHEKLLGLVNALNVWHAVNQTNSTTHESSSEVEELRQQVKVLEHKCELQQVDLHERAAWHSKLMHDKDSLLRKLSEINADGDQVPSDGSQTESSPVHTASKILNRLSTGSNISSASFLTNYRSASRAGSRRLNPRPETPLPPQLPPPKDPLPPIPQEGQSVRRQSILKDHHDKVVKELLDKLQAQQAKSKAIIDTLETKLSQMTIKSSELEKSVRHLQSELQAKVQAASRSPSPPVAQPSSSKKKQSNRRSFNLLTLFGKR
jgi:peptidoglycan hydrolase CwlO-like protein